MKIYVWKCPNCENKGATDIQPPQETQICLLCGDVLEINTFIAITAF